MNRAILTCLAVLSLTHVPCSAKGKGFAPLRPQVLSAKRVFLSGSPPALLDKVYEELGKWGRFQSVSDPAQADVVFEFRYGMVRAPQTASVSVHDPESGNTSYGSATTPGVWSELMTVTDTKTSEVLYEDGRVLSPNLRTLVTHYSMARDMLRDLRKRIEATEALRTIEYTMQFGARAAKFFTDEVALDDKLHAFGDFSDFPKFAAKGNAFAGQLTQWNSETAKKLPELTADDLTRKHFVEPVEKYRDDILAYTCKVAKLQVGVNTYMAKELSSGAGLSADVIQALDTVDADHAALSPDCDSERAQNLLKKQD